MNGIWYQIGILLAICGVIFYFVIWPIIKKRRAKFDNTGVKNDITPQINEKQGKENNIIKQYEPIYARIYDNTNRQVYTKEIPGDIVTKIIDKHRTLGRQWNKEGTYLYSMVKNGEGDYRPLMISAISSYSPEELHNDMQHPYIAITTDMRAKQSFMQKYWVFLWWAAVIAFCIVMLVLGGKGSK